MKYSFKFLPILLCGLFLIACTSCGSKKVKDQEGKEYTSAYICPMHCTGSGSDSPGVCPVCGMDYEANTKQGEGHNHDGHNHDGHDHNHDHHDHNHDGHDHNH